MSYLVLGGAGHTSKVVAEKLLTAGKDVTVLGRNAENLKPLTDQGAKPAVGSLEDVEFLKSAFKDKKAVYALIPPNFGAQDFRSYQQKVAKNIVEAIKVNQTPYVVFLSSVGAHMGNGAGVVDGLADFEKLVKELPGVNVKVLRPGFFYYNFFSQMPTLKAMGIMGGNYGPDVLLPFVDTNDIGEVAAEELLNLNFSGTTVRYIASEEMTPQQATSIIGEAIGKSDLKWVYFPDDQLKAGMVQAGLTESLASGYVELGKAFHEGKGQEDYFKNKPASLGSNKLKDFAKAFAGAYAAS